MGASIGSALEVMGFKGQVVEVTFDNVEVMERVYTIGERIFGIISEVGIRGYTSFDEDAKEELLGYQLHLLVKENIGRQEGILLMDDWVTRNKLTLRKVSLKESSQIKEKVEKGDAFIEAMDKAAALRKL